MVKSTFQTTTVEWTFTSSPIDSHALSVGFRAGGSGVFSGSSAGSVRDRYYETRISSRVFESHPAPLKNAGRTGKNIRSLKRSQGRNHHSQESELVIGSLRRISFVKQVSSPPFNWFIHTWHIPQFKVSEIPYDDAPPEPISDFNTRIPLSREHACHLRRICTSRQAASRLDVHPKIA